MRASGNTLYDVLADLEPRYPGMRLRMINEHEHIRLFVNTTLATDLTAVVADGAEVHLICALSDG